MGGHLRHALLGRNYSLTSQLEGYVVRQVTTKSHQIFDQNENRHCQQVLENLCYVAESYNGEVDRCQADPSSVERSVPVPGGAVLICLSFLSNPYFTRWWLGEDLPWHGKI